MKSDSDSDNNGEGNKISFTDISVLYVKALWLNYAGKKRELNKLSRTVRKIIKLKKTNNQQEFIQLLKNIYAQVRHTDETKRARG